MQSKVENPYYTVNPITESGKFFGQARILRRLFSAISRGESVSLVGPRRIGKTSILRCIGLPEIQTRFEYDLSRHILAFIDVRACLQKTSKDFFEVISDEIVLASNRKGLKTLNLSREGEDRFSNLLEQVKDQGFHTVLLLDAFDNITWNKHFDLSFFEFLRSQASARRVCYVTASISPLSEIVRYSELQSSPFFNYFSRYDVQPLAPDEARALAMIPSSEAGCPFTEDEAEQVLKLAGHHPFFIQRVCHFLFEEKSQSAASEVNWSRVKKEAYTDLLEHFKYMWAELKPEQQEKLKDEAQRQGPQLRELPALSESMLFRKFVRDTCQVSLFRMSWEEMLEEVKDALKHLNDPEFLGKSELGHMRVVSLHLKSGLTSSAIEKGRAVQEVFKEAFERLRGPGMRSDIAPGWKLYNILYYRYFKHHLKPEQIGTWVESTSRRQYYREWNKAIEAFCNIIQEMEVSANKQGEE